MRVGNGKQYETKMRWDKIMEVGLPPMILLGGTYALIKGMIVESVFMMGTGIIMLFFGLNLKIDILQDEIRKQQ